MTKIKGLNWTKVTRPGKPVRWYLYAWRGGPRIGYHEGPRMPRITARELAAYEKAVKGRGVLGTNRFAELLREWLASPEWKALAPGTRKNWIRFIDQAEAKWGGTPLTIWSDPRMLPKIIAWRNEAADKPKTADERVKVLRQLLEWGRLNGRIPVNVANGIPTLYRGGNRADIIWIEEDMAAFTAKALELERPQVVDGMRLAALTGLRRADLVAATFSHVGEKTLSLTAAKVSARKRRRVFVPLIPELRALLEELRSRHRAQNGNTLLVNSFGHPWTGDGFGGSFNRIRDAAGIRHEDGKLKHLHDLRGTYATKLILEGATDKEIAEIMGWAPERVGNIRKVYVDHAKVVVGIAERMGG